MALPYVMVAMVVLLFLASSFVNSLIQDETRAVEESLAKERSGFAMTSLLNYVTNRALRAEFANDAAKINALVGYLAELNNLQWNGNTMVTIEPAVQINASPLAKRVMVSMRYPDEGSGGVVYLFRVKVDIIDANKEVNDDKFLLQFTLATPVLAGGEQLVPALVGLENRLSGLEALFYTNTVSQTGRIRNSTY
ncbi:MAG: hypothetical protein G8345_19905 [Magnetococcales bacterium]|nr:hypothetical protein [Magnetococcales bacterium]